MRAAIFLLVLLTATLDAQDAAPSAAAAPAPDAPAEEKPAEETPESLSGSVTGKQVPELGREALRPSRTLAPSATAYPTQYLLYVAEAMKSFQARDFAGALAYADRADALVPPTVWTLNVRGAVAIEQLKFEEGLKYCLAALKLDPKFFPARFNLSEIPFLQKNYAEARKGWEALYSRMAPDDPTTELLVYRIFLTFLLERDMQGAMKWMEKIPFPSQTPAYQYAHAAWERQNGNLDKWKEWLDSAEFIWPLSKRSAFEDVLLQLGWLKKDGF